MESKARTPDLGSRSFKNIPVFLPGYLRGARTSIAPLYLPCHGGHYIKLTVFKGIFAITKHNLGPCRPMDTQADYYGKVLPHVHYINTWFHFPDPFGERKRVV